MRVAVEAVSEALDTGEQSRDDILHVALRNAFHDGVTSAAAYVRCASDERVVKLDLIPREFHADQGNPSGRDDATRSSRPARVGAGSGRGRRWFGLAGYMGGEAGRGLSTHEDYARLLADVRAIITAGQGRAVAAINRELVATYWAVGERIVREEQGGAARAAYGERTLAQLGQALEREFGRGFGLRSLQLMREFYLAYPIANALRSQLGWTHYRALMRLPDPAQREFYGRLAATGRWSARQLDREINGRLFARVGLSRQVGDLAASLPGPAVDDRALAPADVFKDPYILDFLGLEDTYSERDLEAAILRNIERFLLELGTDFCFVARQRRLTIDGEDYHIDLVFYHRSLRCLVLVDLKLGAFAPADAAQMQLYLEWSKRHDRRDGEEEPIGLILCGSRSEQVVELLLSSQANRMKVAQYLLPEDTAALKARLAQVTAAYEELHEGATGTEPDAPTGR